MDFDNWDRTPKAPASAHSADAASPTVADRAQALNQVMQSHVEAIVHDPANRQWIGNATVQSRQRTDNGYTITLTGPSSDAAMAFKDRLAADGIMPLAVSMGDDRGRTQTSIFVQASEPDLLKAANVSSGSVDRHAREIASGRDDATRLRDHFLEQSIPHDRANYGALTAGQWQHQADKQRESLLRSGVSEQILTNTGQAPGRDANGDLKIGQLISPNAGPDSLTLGIRPSQTDPSQTPLTFDGPPSMRDSAKVEQLIGLPPGSIKGQYYERSVATSDLANALGTTPEAISTEAYHRVYAPRYERSMNAPSAPATPHGEPGEMAHPGNSRAMGAAGLALSGPQLAARVMDAATGNADPAQLILSGGGVGADMLALGSSTARYAGPAGIALAGASGALETGRALARGDQRGANEAAYGAGGGLMGAVGCGMAGAEFGLAAGPAAPIASPALGLTAALGCGIAGTSAGQWVGRQVNDLATKISGGHEHSILDDPQSGLSVAPRSNGRGQATPG